MVKRLGSCADRTTSSNSRGFVYYCLRGRSYVSRGERSVISWTGTTSVRGALTKARKTPTSAYKYGVDCSWKSGCGLHSATTSGGRYADSFFSTGYSATPPGPTTRAKRRLRTYLSWRKEVLGRKLKFEVWAIRTHLLLTFGQSNAWTMFCHRLYRLQTKLTQWERCSVTNTTDSRAKLTQRGRCSIADTTDPRTKLINREHCSIRDTTDSRTKLSNRERCSVRDTTDSRTKLTNRESCSITDNTDSGQNLQTGNIALSQTLRTLGQNLQTGNVALSQTLRTLGQNLQTGNVI